MQRYPVSRHQFRQISDDLAARASGLAGARGAVSLRLRLIAGGAPADPSSWILVCALDLVPSTWLREGVARDVIFVWPDDPRDLTRSRIGSQLRRSGVEVAA